MNENKNDILTIINEIKNAVITIITAIFKLLEKFLKG